MSNVSTWLMAFLAASGVILVYFLFMQATRKGQQSKELAGRIASTEFNMGEGEEAILSMEKEKSPAAETLAGILMVLLPLLGKKLSEEEQRLRKAFYKAGIDSPDAPVYYLFSQWVISIVFVLLALPFITSHAEGMKQIQDILLGGILIVLGLFGPKLFLKNAVDKRIKTLERSFPDTLDLLLVCVESGLGIDAALGRVCKELSAAHPEITKELNQTRMELSLLNDRSRALYGFGERTQIVAFRSLSAALIQSEKFGTSLSDTLRVLADDYRQTRLLKAEDKAGRLPALITIPLITMLMPAFMIVILGPAIVRVIAQGGIFGGG